DRTVRRIARYAGACAAAAAGSAKPVWGHKTTAEQIFELVEPALPNPEGFDAVGDFIETFRQLMTVFIVRDGRTCIPSKMRRAGLSLELAIARWKFSIGLLSRLNEAGVRLHVLRMEDLLMDGPGELKQVCAALDVAYDPIMLTGTQNEKMLPAYRRDKLDPNAAAIPGEQEWVAQIAPELRYLGYRV
ncbi:MAG TPA: hypothetical protein VHZ56_01555, partial [Devosia sp.]|nr:hypothetical protein [Devosia sp.]